MVPTNGTGSRETTPNIATFRVVKFESSRLKMAQHSLFGVTGKKRPFLKNAVSTTFHCVIERLWTLDDGKRLRAEFQHWT